MDVLLRALGQTARDSDDLVGPLAALRLRLIRTVPAVRGRGLQRRLDAQREISRHLAEAFGDRLDMVSAAALTGAFVGAINGALQVLLDDADRLGDRLRAGALARARRTRLTLDRVRRRRRAARPACSGRGRAPWPGRPR
ncbi:hypothetical protein QEZ54_10400 [Catellatospora sp. KI3]|uniref:acyl-CoA-like ligand-binding transcription factor n=1 Tax=Catellatospora sp. KI3 TaxID=3041620 RepID=UPI00248211DA|nr:hypothetical protein [Catellatospora sp. KI3]MDI1461379.1 hypothetical protein [Catellatospora sp. KI3]